MLILTTTAGLRELDAANLIPAEFQRHTTVEADLVEELNGADYDYDVVSLYATDEIRHEHPLLTAFAPAHTADVVTEHGTLTEDDVVWVSHGGTSASWTRIAR